MAFQSCQSGQSRAVSCNSGHILQATDYLREWDFSLDPEAPTWPQADTQTPSSHLHPLDTPLQVPGNNFEESFGDAEQWREWDKAKNSAAGSNISVLTHGPNPCIFVPGPTYTTERIRHSISLNTTSTNSCVSPEVNTPTIPFFRGREFYPNPSDDFDPSIDSVAGATTNQIAADPGNPRFLALARDQPQAAIPNVMTSPTRFRGSGMSSREPGKLNIGFPPQVGFFSASLPTPPLSTACSTSPMSPASPILTKSISRPKKSRMHGTTERKYRMRLNDGFAELLEALPKELLLASGHASELPEANKAISKIEVLDLARRHIGALEKEQSERERENLVLKGQLDFFKRIVNGLGSPPFL